MKKEKKEKYLFVSLMLIGIYLISFVASQTCGDFICEGDETIETCGVDCYVNPEVTTTSEDGAVCGNFICELDETIETCGVDCYVAKETGITKSLEEISQEANNKSSLWTKIILGGLVLIIIMIITFIIYKIFQKKKESIQFPSNKKNS